MANKPKPPKKSNTNHNHNKSRIKLVLVAVVMIALSLGAVFTAKQYFAYKSLDKKIDQVSTLLEQNGISDITKNNDCSAVKLGTTVKCSVSLVVNNHNISPEDAKSMLNSFIVVIDNQDFITLHSRLSDNVLVEQDSVSSITKLEKDGLGHRGQCSASIDARGNTLDGEIICGYKAWWKQIL